MTKAQQEADSLALVRDLAAISPLDIQTGDDASHKFWTFHRRAAKIVHGPVKVYFWRRGEYHYWATESVMRHDSEPEEPAGPFESMQQTWDDAGDFVNGPFEPVWSIAPRFDSEVSRRLRLLDQVAKIAAKVEAKQRDRELTPLDMVDELDAALHEIAELTKEVAA